MKVYELKCSNCGADLKVSADRKIIFCEYCGTKNLIDDEIIRSEVNHSGTIVYRDEAKLRELELKEAERIREENKRKAKFRRWYLIVIIVAISSFALGIIINIIEKRTGELGTNPFLSLIGVLPCVAPFFYPYEYSERHNFFLYLRGLFICYCVFIICSIGGDRFAEAIRHIL